MWALMNINIRKGLHMENIIYFCYVMVAMFLGEWVSSRTRTWVPSLLITAIIFLVGFWTIIPKNMVAKASFGTAFINIAIGLLLVHLGTLMSFRKLIQQWRAVCIALIGVAGTMILTMTIGIHFFGKTLVVATVPTLTGGLVSAALMTQGLKAAGITSIIAYPVTMFVIHHIVSFPLITSNLKREGKRLQGIYAQDPEAASASVKKDTHSSQKRQRFFTPTEGYDTSAFIMAKVAAVAIFSFWISSLTANKLNSNVLCLIFGVIFHEIGWLPDNALNRAETFKWLMYGLIAYILGELSVASPHKIVGILLQVIILALMGLIGMFVVSIILAKPFGMSKSMAFACALTALCGFPADYVLTNDVVNTLTDDEDEKEYLLDNMLPKMLVGGFATVSIASIIIASVFLKML